MRHIRYSVAMSLDGFIAGPNGEFDWIPADPEIDFNELYVGFDTILIGRKSLLATGAKAEDAEVIPGMKTYVFSSSLQRDDYPKFTIIAGNVEETVAALKQEDGKDIWLLGGGELSRSLNRLDLGVDVGIIPILLGEGIPLPPVSTKQTN